MKRHSVNALSPARIWILVWALAFGTWALTGPDQVRQITGAVKYVSASAIVLTLVAICVLPWGVIASRAMFSEPPLGGRARGQALRAIEDFVSTERGSRALMHLVLWPTVSAGVLLVVSVVRVGGVGGLLGAIGGGATVNSLLGDSLDSGLMRILVSISNLLVVAAVLLVVARGRLRSERWRRAGIAISLLVMLSVAFCSFSTCSHLLWRRA
jgi:hypothetical protein